MIAKLSLFFLIFSHLSTFAQDNVIIAGNAPKISVFLVENDNLNKIVKLKKDVESRIKIRLDGGIENVKHQIIVTSKNALISTVPQSSNEYLVKPLHYKECEIIIDLKTMEDYYVVKDTKTNGFKTHRTMEKMPPRTYMIGYEKFLVE